jgi:hypothetical protein
MVSLQSGFSAAPSKLAPVRFQGVVFTPTSKGVDMMVCDEPSKLDKDVYATDRTLLYRKENKPLLNTLDVVVDHGDRYVMADLTSASRGAIRNLITETLESIPNAVKVKTQARELVETVKDAFSAEALKNISQTFQQFHTGPIMSFPTTTGEVNARLYNLE